MNRQTDGRTDGRADGRTDGPTDVSTNWCMNEAKTRHDGCQAFRGGPVARCELTHPTRRVGVGSGECVSERD